MIPVVNIVDQVLATIPDAPINADCRQRLVSIRDGIFLELPETRLSLLCSVGQVINESVPSGETNNPIGPHWYEVRDYLAAQLEQATIK